MDFIIYFSRMCQSRNISLDIHDHRRYALEREGFDHLLEAFGFPSTCRSGDEPMAIHRREGEIDPSSRENTSFFYGDPDGK